MGEGEGVVALTCNYGNAIQNRQLRRNWFAGLQQMLVTAPAFEYLGWNERGPTYSYRLHAQGDEVLLNSKTVPVHSPFVSRSAGDALHQLTEAVLPGAFDSTAVQLQSMRPTAWRRRRPRPG